MSKIQRWFPVALTALTALTALAMLGPATPALAQAEDDFEPALRIERDDGASGVPRDGLRLTVGNQRQQFRLNEPIRFTVQGNRTFYLWAYTLDDRGQAVVLVPSAAQRGNKYEAGRPHTLPNPGVSFYADQTGPHEITLIASTQWLDIDRWLQRRGRKSGELLEIPAADLEAAFEEHQIVIRRDGGGGGRPQPVQRRDVVVQYLGFDVVR